MIRKKILVTGGTGYIGSHTVVELIKNNYEVIILDNLSNSSKEVVDSIEIITGIRPIFEKIDILDVLNLELFFNKNLNISGIIHFAALKSVNESIEKPLEYYSNNIIGLINVLNQAKINNIKSFIFSSSCTVYGQPIELPVTEKTKLQPVSSVYGHTKKIGEEILEMVANKNLKIISLRYFNPIGAHESSLIGEYPNGIPSNLMPFITQTAIGLREKLLVYGNDYNTIDGTAIRDFIHVTDLANAHIKSIERLLNSENETHYEVFNIGTGNGYSVLDLINSFEKTTYIKLNWEFAPRREGDIEKIYANPSLANSTLNWNAKFNLDSMTKSAWEWENKINKIK